MVYPDNDLTNSDYTSVALVSVKPVGVENAVYTPLPTPSSYRMTSSTLVDSGRNAGGVIVSQVIREGIRKIECEWNFLSQSQFSVVAKLFENASVGGTGGFLSYLRYYDTIRGEIVDSETETIPSTNTPRQFYVGDRVSDTAQLVIKNGKIQGYANVKLSLIEV